MNFLHYEFHLNSNDIVEVTLDKQANVRLLDDINFMHYRNGQRHTYYGGLAHRSPIRIKAPHAAHWHLVVDLGGYSGTVSASTAVIKGA